MVFARCGKALVCPLSSETGLNTFRFPLFTLPCAVITPPLLYYASRGTNRKLEQSLPPTVTRRHANSYSNWRGYWVEAAELISNRSTQQHNNDDEAHNTGTIDVVNQNQGFSQGLNGSLFHGR